MRESETNLAALEPTMSKSPAAKMTIECDRCDGKGRIYGFSHYAAGICFACEGKGQRKVTPYTQEVTAEMAERIAKAEAEEKIQRAFVDAHKGLSTDQLVKKLGNIGPDKMRALHAFVAQVSHVDESARPMLAVCKRLLERYIIAA